MTNRKENNFYFKNKAQQWLDKEYPRIQRNEIIQLDISEGKIKRWDGHEQTLKGELKLERFVNLQKLTVSSHKLTSLDVSECSCLVELDCRNNELTDLTLPKDAGNLKDLDLSHNKFHQNLFFLQGAFSLKGLHLANNKFIGSLDYLSEMKQLECLDISDTDLNCQGVWDMFDIILVENQTVN